MGGNVFCDRNSQITPATQLLYMRTIIIVNSFVTIIF